MSRAIELEKKYIDCDKHIRKARIDNASDSKLNSLNLRQILITLQDISLTLAMMYDQEVQNDT